MVYDRADEYHIGSPSEVCEACSDFEGGRLVPVTFCPEAKSKMEPPPWE